MKRVEVGPRTTLGFCRPRAAVLGVLVVSLAWSGCSGGESPSPRTSPAVEVAEDGAKPKLTREPAVAGLFYPKEKAELSRMIDGFLAKASPEAVPDLRALVCPHAGYVYSGQTAAFGYRLLQGREFTTVVLLAPSHYAALTGASVCGAEVFRTPLGDVPISAKAKILAKKPPFALEPRCPVQRPAWSRQSSRSLPAAGEDTAETWEHSDEVQVPFLQKTLTRFQLVPVVMGEVDPEKAARALAEVWDEQTLVVVSSDLSHFHPYSEAKGLDKRCVDAVCQLDVTEMSGQEACGKTPILTLLHLAKLKGWRAKLLDYRNSGDVTGEKERGVVGYAAIAFDAPRAEAYSAGERTLLLELARTSLQRAAAGQSPLRPARVSDKLQQQRACFVTLKKAGELRGCIGHLAAMEALFQAVIDNARSAALEDRRFTPVPPSEVADIRIEISVLTEPVPLPFKSPEDLLAKLRPNRDGVILQIDSRRATFLPQVWAQLPDKVAFLNQLSQKAGSPPAAWRGPNVSVSVYQVESFEETD